MSFFLDVRHSVQRFLGRPVDIDHIRPRGQDPHAALKPSNYLEIDATTNMIESATAFLATGRRGAVVPRPPAGRALSVLQFVMPRKAFERVFAQTFADFRQEYFDDLAEGRNGRARWQHLFFYGRLGITIVVWSISTIGKKLVELWRISG